MRPIRRPRVAEAEEARGEINVEVDDDAGGVTPLRFLVVDMILRAC